MYEPENYSNEDSPLIEIIKGFFRLIIIGGGYYFGTVLLAWFFRVPSPHLWLFPLYIIGAFLIVCFLYFFADWVFS